MVISGRNSVRVRIATVDRIGIEGDRAVEFRRGKAAVVVRMRGNAPVAVSFVTATVRM